MNSFVKNSHGGGGAPNGRPRSRQQVAANAKVSMQQVQANKKQSRVEANTAAQQQSSVQRRSSGQHDQPGGLRQLPQQGRSANMHRDAYGTDAGSIDTTVQGGSIHLEGNHIPESDYGDIPDDELYEEEESEEDAEEEEESVGQQYHYEGPAYAPHNLHEVIHSRVPAHIQDQVRQFNQYHSHDVSSYPPTTSGNPDESREVFDGKQESVPDDDDNRSHISPTPRRDVQDMFAPVGHAFQRPASVSELRGPAENNRNIFQQGALIRGNRPATVMSVRPLQAQRRTSTPPESGPPHIHNQSNRHHNEPISAHVKEEGGLTNIEGRQALPQRGAGSRRALPPEPTNAGKLTRPGPITRTAVRNDEPSYTVQPLSPLSTDQKFHPGGSPEGPLEDYDLPALYAMDYEQLKNENFDTVPRALAPVLSEDMAKKPLNERLEHVHRSLDPGDQSKFFISVPTSEWEEAGEWFLEKFGEIMKKTREARQAKRKLAMEFEEEVEKRHRQVVKKQRQVDEALQKMSAHGQGLLPPKSPRGGSKSPARC